MSNGYLRHQRYLRKIENFVMHHYNDAQSEAAWYMLLVIFKLDLVPEIE